MFKPLWDDKTSISEKVLILINWVKANLCESVQEDFLEEVFHQSILTNSIDILYNTTEQNWTFWLFVELVALSKVSMADVCARIDKAMLNHEDFNMVAYLCRDYGNFDVRKYRLLQYTKYGSIGATSDTMPGKIRLSQLGNKWQVNGMIAGELYNMFPFGGLTIDIINTEGKITSFEVDDRDLFAIAPTIRDFNEEPEWIGEED